MKKTNLIVWQRIITIIVLLTASLVVSCNPATPAPPTVTPKPPGPGEAVITPAEKTEVLAGNKLSVRASAEGATNYEWTLQGDGDISSEKGERILYIAPEAAVTGGTMAILTVGASNDYGKSSASLEINVVASESVTITLDALGVPAGWMSSGDDPKSFIELESGQGNCPPDAEADCLKFTYEAGGGWGGIYWWPPTCGETGTIDAWDRVRSGTCRVNILEKGNMSTVDQLIFRAQGELGGEVIEFKIGGADIAPRPGRSTGKVTLTKEWQQYSLDLEGLDLTNVVGLFLWVAADIDNPEGAVFYLDSIQFEGVK